MKTFAWFLFSSLFFFKAQAVETVPFVDLNKYVGVWYEVASIPQSFQIKCVSNTKAEYSFAEKNMIRVLNTCEQADGTRDGSEGRARITDPQTNSKLEVTFVKFIDWIFAFGGKYWIIGLDEDYTVAVVGDPTTKYAWILSRNPAISNEALQFAYETLESQGYDMCKILTSIQDGGFTKRAPLCEL